MNRPDHEIEPDQETEAADFGPLENKTFKDGELPTVEQLSNIAATLVGNCPGENKTTAIDTAKQAFQIWQACHEFLHNETYTALRDPKRRESLLKSLSKLKAEIESRKAAQKPFEKHLRDWMPNARRAVMYETYRRFIKYIFGSEIDPSEAIRIHKEHGFEGDNRFDNADFFAGMRPLFQQWYKADIREKKSKAGAKGAAIKKSKTGKIN
jgi:hypothetical protein